MSDDPKLTPMFAQYRALKARFPDAILLFRLGDFYETFEQDARTCARELELVLTHRSFAKGVRLPMAGVPHHHVQAYIARLIDKGFKVALVEQLEDPRKVKRLVKRDVVRVITPGTVVEDALLKSKSDNYLAAISFASAPAPGLSRHRSRRKSRANGSAPTPDSEPLADSAPNPSPDDEPASSESSSFIVSFGLAFIDLSTGEFATTQIDGPAAETKLLDELDRVQASEYVLPESLARDDAFVASLQRIRAARVSPLPDSAFDPDTACRTLLDHFHVNTLHPFGCADLPLASSAAGAALAYLNANQPHAESSLPPQGDARLDHVNHLWTYHLDNFMTLDAATRRNLELTASLAPDNATRNGARSLFAILDHTETAMGARLLKRWIHQPLLDLDAIHARQDAVAELHADAFLRADLRQLLDGLYDVERLVGRIGFGTANARDLIGLKRALLRLPRIKTRLNNIISSHLRTLNAELDPLDDVLRLIDRALVEDPPILIREGGLIKEGFDPTLDELRDGAAQGRAWLAHLESAERERTGIKNLRVRYNEVFGFFLEAPRRDAHLIPAHYERRATISHAERYVTPELKKHEAQLLSTQDRAHDLEYELFTRLRREVASHSSRLQTAARILAQVDALGALAEAAARYNYVRPTVDDGDRVDIREGRHPIVERFLHDGEFFVPNDVQLDRDACRIIILTGPNMSGKSVFIRQVALIVLMAQLGSFVPAASAHIGLADRIFTRVGASDDIAGGRSTFLVEMSETSHILHHATPRSLIVLDEVGRGTSTYDGISLAWAIAEELHNVVGAKTLFATHYHELTGLAAAPTIADRGAAVRNFTLAVEERDNTVVFLRQVIPGGAEKSFGIHVARLAGLPERVVARAAHVLSDLEADRAFGNPEHSPTQPTAPDSRAPSDREPARDPAEHHADESPVPYTTSAPAPSVSPSPVLATASSDSATAPGSSLIPHTSSLVLLALSSADIANLTPLQALNLLNDLQQKLQAP